MKNSYWLLTTMALAGCPVSASAGLLNSNELIAVIESTVVDLDVLAISFIKLMRAERPPPEH